MNTTQKLLNFCGIGYGKWLSPFASSFLLILKRLVITYSYPLIFIIFSSLFLSTKVLGQTSQVITTDSFVEIANFIDAKAKQFTGQAVLVAFDVDDTLLTMPQILGSAAWFDWQHSLLKENSEHPLLVANKIEDLISLQALIFDMFDMEISERSIPEFIDNFNNAGINMLILTARDKDMASSTSYAIAKNFPLADQELLMPSKVKLAVNNNHEHCWQDNFVRAVKFDKGAIYTAGQDKRVALQCLLKNAEHKIKSVILIDDDIKNIESFCNSGKNVENSTLEFNCVHYTANSPKRVEIQLHENKIKSDNSWQKLKSCIANSMSIKEEKLSAEIFSKARDKTENIGACYYY